MHGIYWLCLRDGKNGVSVFNRGCMGSAIQGNRVLIPLVYSNEYMCGTQILDGVYDDEFAIYPFASDMSDASLHTKALSYAYQPECACIKAGDGDLAELNPLSFNADSESVILTSLYPENGCIYARFCNYSDAASSAVLTSDFGVADAETDLLANVTAEITDGKLSFRPWEIKTVRIKLL